MLRVMIDLVPSRKYCVGRRGRFSMAGSTSTQSMPVRSTCSFSNRFAGLQDAPRPRTGTELWGVSSTTDLNFFFSATMLSSHEHIPMSSSNRALANVCNSRPLASALTERRYSCSRSNQWQSCRDILLGGGRAVDCAGLEIRFEDFGLNCTRFASNGLFS